ncbi:hypothetical protein W03_13640 [Nitrosomonas sp. PY1]|uniref:hypothetical protein n=1 Tax=Nitrosomonas sp. PY1 TaxID=1803906 RepID=UPI001FC8BFD9|nr:hypothetical protein [Nitrosomonas sp. PY1]GKS69360.1 hypothetical protein W03_13640 [Nitrosomonas sp. PY1]
MRETSTLIFVGIMVINSPSWAMDDDSQKTHAQVSPTVNFGEEKERPVITNKKDIAPGKQDPRNLQLNETNKKQARDTARRVPSF